MKENRKLLQEVLKEIRHDMTDEEVLNLLADSKISVSPKKEKEKYTLGQRAADTIAKFAGSWAFIFSFAGVLILWMVVNAILATKAFDPYPFILLNTDEIVDVLFDEYGLLNDLPVVSVGGSMGGLSALVYMVYAKRTPVACVANCPVCDLPYHFTERPDLPRTLYSAFYNYDCSLQEALKSASPCDLVDRMPVNSKYYIFHCMKDTSVNKQKHSDRFVEKMKEKHDIVYYSVPDRGHCDLTDEMTKLYNKHIESSILDR